MATLWNRAGHYMFILSFVLSSFFFSWPNLSRRRMDVCHTSTHGVALVQIEDAGLKRAARHAARWKYRMQKIAKNWPSVHHRTTVSGCIFATKACIDNRKKNLLNCNISSRCPHNMANFGPLTAEIGLPVWGTPANFSGFRVLAVLLYGTLVVCVSQTLRRWTEGATYIRQGGHHVGHWPTFLVSSCFIWVTVALYLILNMCI